MPTDVRCLVETELSYPVLRLAGDLDAAGAGPVRSAVLRLLLDQPAGLIVDVSQVRAVDPAALAVLTEVLVGSADWTDTRVVLCTARDAAAQPWAGTGLKVCPGRQAGLAALGEPAPRRLLNARLEPAAGAARRARELVTEAGARWELPGLVGPGCIVVTEMVNNVVAHVRGVMTVTLICRDDGLAVIVQDGSSTLPRFTGPVAPTSYGGRGLLLIDSVARRWGAVPLDEGKIVWAVLDPEDDPTSGSGSGTTNGRSAPAPRRTGQPPR